MQLDILEIYILVCMLFFTVLFLIGLITLGYHVHKETKKSIYTDEIL